MYTHINFKTKKQLRERVAHYVNAKAGHDKGCLDPDSLRVTVFQPNGDLTGTVAPESGKVYLEGPHYPEPHTWYAEAWLENGCVVKVR